jgi:pimeloyl-ACP methyl ester carboxylesterase
MNAEVLQNLTRRERSRVVQANLAKAVEGLDFHTPEESVPNERPISDFRRGRLRRVDDTVGMLTLVDVDGVLFWREGTVGAALVGRRRRAGAAAAAGQVVAQLKFEKLPTNEVWDFLRKLDDKLTPQHANGTGLRRWNGTELVPVERPKGEGRTLLFVHGTFSNSESLIDQFKSLETKTGFLARAHQHYQEILTFDHPTLSVSPMLNALDLARLFAGFSVPVDLICHSRGGLVARWWLEGFGGATHGQRRAVLVGSPLGGTSLASPASLRGALNLLTNVGNALEIAGAAASTWMPLLSFGVGLMKVITSITSLTAREPILDAALAMVPGLSCQSRVGNSAELLRLRRGSGSPWPAYFAVTSDFQTAKPGWKFWHYFVNLKGFAADYGADLIFQSPNDLVVDTASMRELSDTASIASNDCLEFKTNETVFHTNYFQQRKTSDFILQKLQIP